MENKILIKGIDEVIAGLTTIKGALISKENSGSILEAVKEAVGEVVEEVIQIDPEVLPEVVEANEESLNTITEVETMEEEIEETMEEEIEETMEEDLEGMTYRELQTLAKERGVLATGKKDELIDRLKDSSEELTEEEDLVEEEEENAEEVIEDSEEDSYDEEDYIEFKNFLAEMDMKELTAISNEAGYEVKSKAIKTKVIEKLISDLDVLIQTLEDLGYYDEDETEEEEIEDTPTTAEKYGLNDYTLDQLANICTNLNLSTNGKKQSLIDRVVKEILDGESELSRADIDLLSVGHVDLEEEDFEKSAKMLEMEDVIVKDLEQKYKDGKLKKNAVKKFVEDYFRGDPSATLQLSEADEEEILAIYTEIHAKLVSDEGEINDFEEPYERGGKYHCCGSKLIELDNGNLYCEICGVEYEA